MGMEGRSGEHITEVTQWGPLTLYKATVVENMDEKPVMPR